MRVNKNDAGEQYKNIDISFISQYFNSHNFHDNKINTYQPRVNRDLEFRGKKAKGRTVRTYTNRNIFGILKLSLGILFYACLVS